MSDNEMDTAGATTQAAVKDEGDGFEPKFSLPQGEGRIVIYISSLRL